MKKQEPPISLRISKSLKERIKKAAKLNGQTAHGRIVFLLEKAHK